MQFWFDFASTYSYLAASRIEDLAAGAGVPLDWRAFLLGPIFQKQGWNDSPFNIFSMRGRYMWRDVERQCLRYGIPFRRPSRFPRRSILPARVACLTGSEPWGPEFVRRVFRANFGEDRDIDDPEVVSSILESLGQSREWMERATDDENKGRLRSQTGEAERLGIFGAPTFLVGGELFWGNDRLKEALEWHRAHPPV